MMHRNITLTGVVIYDIFLFSTRFGAIRFHIQQYTVICTPGNKNSVNSKNAVNPH